MWACPAADGNDFDWIGPKHHQPRTGRFLAGVIMENRTALITVIEHASEPGVWRIESLAPTDRTTALRAAIQCLPERDTPSRARPEADDLPDVDADAARE